MLLNWAEKFLMNNPVRAAIQRHFEARRLLAMGGPVRAAGEGGFKGGVALEMGCGRGVGTELILDVFGAARVDAFDLDPHMVALARRRLAAPRAAGRARLWVGDAARIAARDGAYDAVFDFGIIHHLPGEEKKNPGEATSSVLPPPPSSPWRDAIGEARRLLKPGGRFYAEEVYAAFIAHPLWRRVLDHPQEDRFDHARFCGAIRDAGFRVVAERTLGKSFGWVVAEKPASS